MGRLHYDNDRNDDTPKVLSRGTSSRSVEAPTEESEGGGGVANTLEKIAKLIPSEIIIGYLSVVGLIPSISKGEMQPTVQWAMFGLFQIMTPLYLNKMAEAGKPKMMHLLVCSVAFAVWAYVTNGQKLIPNYYDAAFGSILLVVFSVVSGLVPLKK